MKKERTGEEREKRELGTPKMRMKRKESKTKGRKE